MAPAAADSTVVVRGTAFPDQAAQLSLVGCENPYERAAEVLTPRFGFGPDLPPAGERTIGYDLAGGNALGSQFTVSSMARTTTASMAVHAADGASGVAYAGYQAPADFGTREAWFGRAELDVAAGRWQGVEATWLAYTWTKYDMDTGEVLEAGPPQAWSVRDFMAQHGGDGPGLYAIGFGCDGRQFSMDALRVGPAGGVTTYDLEGLTTATTMAGRHAVITAGEQVDLRGSLRVLAGGTHIPHASLFLEQQVPGSTGWQRVDVVDAADATVTVAPLERTLYRWRFMARPLAEASRSLPFVVEVVPVVTAGLVDGLVVGHTTPAKPGTRVSLARQTAKGLVTVDRVAIDELGGFSFLAPAEPGRYVVTLPPTPGNLSATSSTVVVPDASAR